MRSLNLLFAALLVLAAGQSARASGLLVPTDQNLPPLRITDHLVDVTIRDRVALTTLKQTFHNNHDRRVEATYIFPLPEEGDLTDFQMTFNGKMVKGEVLPADEARQIYESIVRQAKDPGLIEFIGRRLLRMRIFPIEPKSDTTIQISYQQITRPISDMSGYHYPLRTSRSDGRAYGTVRFEVDLHSTQALKNIWSPTHSVEIVRDGDYKAKVGYEAAGGSLEEDFILLYNTDSSDLGLSVIAHKPRERDAGHFLLLLTPKQLWPEQEYTPQDVVFVIDTSGSMGGEKIDQAKQSLKYCVEQLDERDRFSVVRFSTGFDVAFDDLQPASAENKQRAREFIDKFTASGGTNIADTLKHVAGMNPRAEGRPFVIVFITDGQGNRTPDEIMAVLKDAGGDDAAMRIFPFGVGHDVNTKLLDRLANSYKGRPTYVQPGEDLELVLGGFFSTISQPVLTNLALEIPDIGLTERFPVTLPDLYHGQQLTIAGQFSQPKTGTVKLIASRSGKRVEYSWPDVSFTNTAEANYVAPIWAGRKIAWMIDEIRLHGENDEMIKEIVSLSKDYGIQTPYTSWLVNPEGEPIVLTRRMRDVFDGEGGFRGAPSIRLGEALERTNAPATPPFPAGQGSGAGGLRSTTGWTSDLAMEAVVQESGRDATIIANYQRALREADSTEAGGRIAGDYLAIRTVANRTYYRVGPFLVDERVDESRQLVMVLFASEAYFDILAARPDLKPVFAASRNVVVPIGKKMAIVIVDETGENVLEEISEELREQLEPGKSSNG